MASIPPAPKPATTQIYVYTECPDDTINVVVSLIIQPNDGGTVSWVTATANGNQTPMSYVGGNQWHGTVVFAPPDNGTTDWFVAGVVGYHESTGETAYPSFDTTVECGD